MILICILLMVIDHRFHSHFAPLRAYLTYLIHPVHWFVDAPHRWGTEMGYYFSTHQDLVNENILLREEQLLNEGRLQKMDALLSENARLRQLLKSSPRSGETFIVSEILQIDPDPFTHQVILDKGSQQGVYLGQPVLDAKGVMGEIIDVYLTTSRAMLITDASHAIPVENSRNGVRAIAAGTGGLDKLELQHVQNTSDIVVGDQLVTSGLGGRYPTGYPVGVVQSVDHDPGKAFARIVVSPTAQLERSRQVLLVQSNKEDLT